MTRSFGSIILCRFLCTPCPVGPGGRGTRHNPRILLWMITSARREARCSKDVLVRPEQLDFRMLCILCDLTQVTWLSLQSQPQPVSARSGRRIVDDSGITTFPPMIRNSVSRLGPSHVLLIPLRLRYRKLHA